MAGLLLAPALLFFPTQAGAAKRQPQNVRLVAHPVQTLAMDWPRVAYATGKDGSSETVHVWNVATGVASVVTSKRGFATHHTTQIAISGKRLAWIRTAQLGNSELDHWLYTSSLGGPAHLLREMRGSTDTDCGLGGPQIGGLVGSGDAMAVSTWTDSSDGSVASNQRLSLIAPTGLRTIATGPDAVRSESADGGYVAVLPTPSPTPGAGSCERPLPRSADVYSTDGTLLRTIQLPLADAGTLGYQLALSGNELVVLTFGLHEPDGPAWVTLTVYDWTTGELLDTWPVGIQKYPGVVSFAVHGRLAAVESYGSLHLVNLTTGKDVVVAPSSHSGTPPALDSHGLVYAVYPNRKSPGKLVFVPTAKLLARAG